MSDLNHKRETFYSRLGFIFLSAGCAIGLGNVWRFPFITGKYGGAAFVLIYLLFLIALALPILIMEFSVGRASRKSPLSAFETLQPKNKIWSLWGYGSWIGCTLLMMFYTVVTGWMLAYTFYSAKGSLTGIQSNEVGAFFGGLLSNPQEMMSWMALAILIGSAVCYLGLRNGVERITKFVMGGLLIIMFALVARAVTLEGESKGFEFYLKPDFEKLMADGIGNTLYAALGQAFFTLSLGVGSMEIFGSYLPRENERTLLGESLIVASLDTFVAFMAGLIIFPSCFAYGITPDAGPGLIFVTLPNMFNFMPAGRLWGALFFLFMSFAALSTVIAVFEAITACFMDKFNWSRKFSVVVMTVLIFILSIPCALGFNIWSNFEPLGTGTNVLDLEDFILSDNLLPIGALVYLLFCVSKYGWGWKNFLNEANRGHGAKFSNALYLYVKYIIPTVMLIILVVGYYNRFAK